MENIIVCMNYWQYTQSIEIQLHYDVIVVCTYRYIDELRMNNY